MRQNIWSLVVFMEKSSAIEGRDSSPWTNQTRTVMPSTSSGACPVQALADQAMYCWEYRDSSRILKKVNWSCLHFAELEASHLQRSVQVWWDGGRKCELPRNEQFSRKATVFPLSDNKMAPKPLFRNWENSHSLAKKTPCIDNETLGYYPLISPCGEMKLK